MCMKGPCPASAPRPTRQTARSPAHTTQNTENYSRPGGDVQPTNATHGYGCSSSRRGYSLTHTRGGTTKKTATRKKDRIHVLVLSSSHQPPATRSPLLGFLPWLGAHAPLAHSHTHPLPHGCLASRLRCLACSRHCRVGERARDHHVGLVEVGRARLAGERAHGEGRQNGGAVDYKEVGADLTRKGGEGVRVVDAIACEPARKAGHTTGIGARIRRAHTCIER
jgi:hypothetical protein